MIQSLRCALTAIRAILMTWTQQPMISVVGVKAKNMNQFVVSDE